MTGVEENTKVGLTRAHWQALLPFAFRSNVDIPAIRAVLADVPDSLQDQILSAAAVAEQIDAGAPLDVSGMSLPRARILFDSLEIGRAHV